MPDSPLFLIRPPLRCAARSSVRPGQACANRAEWQRREQLAAGAGFFCSAHRAPGDEPIAPDAPFRQVTVIADVIFAGVETDGPAAEAEALERLEHAVTEAGGTISLHSVRSVIGRQRTPAGLAGPNPLARGRRHGH